jgi:hypothetical protein
MTSTDRQVELPGGVLITADAYWLMREMTVKGVTLRVRQGILEASPVQRLTPRDKDRLRRLKYQLINLIEYLE